jgi:hypothetical protein
MPIFQVRSVPDIATLRITFPDDVLGADGDTIVVLGNSSPNDGGGGIFEWDEGGLGTDDGWATIRSSVTGGGRWRRTGLVSSSIATTTQVAASLTALRSLDGAQGAVAAMKGYATTNDGGQGTFDWDATVVAGDDDGGTIIFASGVGSGGWRRRYTGDVNARWFGAENSTTLQSALNAAITAGRPLYIPSGDYTITAEVLTQITGAAALAQAIRVYGDGPGRTVFLSQVSNAACLRFETVTPATDTAFFLDIEGIEFRGDGDTNGNGIEIQDIQMGAIKRCYFRSLSGSGIRMDSTLPDTSVVKTWKIERCRARSCGGYGIQSVGAALVLGFNLELALCDIQACSDGGVYAETSLFLARNNIIASCGTGAGSDGAIRVVGRAGNTASFLGFRENAFEANVPHHVKVERASQVSIERNSFRRLSTDEDYFIHIGDGVNSVTNVRLSRNTYSSSVVGAFTAVKGEASVNSVVVDDDLFNIQVADTEVDVDGSTFLAYYSGGRPTYSNNNVRFAPGNSITPDTTISRVGIGTIKVDAGVVNETQTVTSSGNEVDVDCSAGQNVLHTLTENTEVQNPIRTAAGQVLRFIFTQTTGNAFTVTWDTDYDVTAALTVTADRKSTISFLYDGTSWVELSRAVDAV